MRRQKRTNQRRKGATRWERITGRAGRRRQLPNVLFEPRPSPDEEGTRGSHVHDFWGRRTTCSCGASVYDVCRYGHPRSESKRAATGFACRLCRNNYLRELSARRRSERREVADASSIGAQLDLETNAEKKRSSAASPSRAAGSTS